MKASQYPYSDYHLNPGAFACSGGKKGTQTAHHRLHTQVYKQAELLSQHLFLFHQKARGKAAIANPLLSQVANQCVCVF